jgi:hypothetical protein
MGSGIRSLRIEASPVSASLDALRNHHVGAGVFDRPGLLEPRSRHTDADPEALCTFDDRRGRQSEVKAQKRRAVAPYRLELRGERWRVRRCWHFGRTRRDWRSEYRIHTLLKGNSVVRGAMAGHGVKKRSDRNIQLRLCGRGGFRKNEKVSVNRWYWASREGFFAGASVIARIVDRFIARSFARFIACFNAFMLTLDELSKAL